jgi:hypothetical protein
MSAVSSAKLQMNQSHRIAEAGSGATPVNDYFANLKLLKIIYHVIFFQYYHGSISALKQVLVKDLNRDHL